MTEMENQVNKTELTGDDRNQPWDNDQTLQKTEDLSNKTTQKLHQVLNTVEDTTEVSPPQDATLSHGCDLD